MATTRGTIFTRARRLLNDGWEDIADPSFTLAEGSSVGGLGAGTYYVVVTSLAAPYGEGLPIRQSIVVTGADNKITVTITEQRSVRGFKIYAATASGSELYIITKDQSQGASTTYDITAMPSGTAAIPTIDKRSTLSPYDQMVEAGRQAFAALTVWRPQIKALTQAGDGSAFDFTQPADWEDDISQFLALEYPTSSRIPSFYKPVEDYIWPRLFEDKFRTSFTFATGNTGRYWYTVSHALPAADGTNTTLTDRECEVMTALWAARICDIKRAEYAAQEDARGLSDATDSTGRSTYWASLARSYSAQAEALARQLPAWHIPAYGAILGRIG